jgi:HlyD family secretion protein
MTGSKKARFWSSWTLPNSVTRWLVHAPPSVLRKPESVQTVATVKEAQGNLARLQEVARLSAGKVPSQAELDTGHAALERAQAEEKSARAGVMEAQAAAATDETNLSKASIRSPIDGVVLTRSVDPGNAVAASLQAVTLFTVAEDLAKLRLQVNVDEADVGSVKVGQKARFTVSAYPARKYPATITRVAYGSTTTDNVVTYQTYLEVDNSDLSLRPGMTASSTITSTELNDALLVPNTALRFTPSNNGGGGAGGKGRNSVVSTLLPRMPSTGARKTAGGKGPAKQVWVLRDGAPVAVAVTPGISDGRMTEITGRRTAGWHAGDHRSARCRNQAMSEAPLIALSGHQGLRQRGHGPGCAQRC